MGANYRAFAGCFSRLAQSFHDDADQPPVLVVEDVGE